MPTSYQPKAFDKNAFRILEKVIEALIDTKGNDALTPFEAAMRMDKFLFDAKAPSTGQMNFILKYINNFKPWFIPRLKKLEKLSVEKRQKAIKEFIGQGGIMRDIARGLKVMAVAPYYSSPQGMAQTGFIKFEDREDSKNRDQNPITHPDN